MNSECELVFFSHFRMNANAGTCWSRLFLAHFTTLFRMVTKISIKQILFPWLVQAREIKVVPELPSAVFSVCQNCYQKLVSCWHVFWQIHKFQIHKLVSRTWPFEYKYNVQCFWLKRILNIIIKAGIFREYRNKCFWRPECFGKGTTSDYTVADIRREIPFFPSVLHA